jgi:hypothetical protein
VVGTNKWSRYFKAIAQQNPASLVLRLSEDQKSRSSASEKVVFKQRAKAPLPFLGGQGQERYSRPEVVWSKLTGRRMAATNSFVMMAERRYKISVIPVDAGG